MSIIRNIKQLPGSFSPSNWNEVVGNKEIVEHFKSLLYQIRYEGLITGVNTLLTGPSRSGKTESVKQFLRSLLCMNLNPETLAHCGACVGCQSHYECNGNEGSENESAYHIAKPFFIGVRIVNCAAISEAELDEIVRYIRTLDENVKVVFLDEAHRLKRRRLDEWLLKYLEDTPAIWIASSAVIKMDSADDDTKLDRMFQNRFPFRLKTQLPTQRELAVWLARICQRFELTVEEPASRNLQRIAERSNCVPGLALQVLNRAALTRDRFVTQESIETFCFSFDE